MTPERPKRRQAPTGEWQYQGADGYWYDEPEAANEARSQVRGSGVIEVPNPGTAASTIPVGAWMAIIAGALMAIGSLLPWLSASAPLGVSISRNGFQLGAHGSFSVDGVAALFLGVVTVVIGIARITNSQQPVFLQRSPIITGGAAILLCILDYSSINDLAQNVISASNGIDSASVSYGFWLVGVGGALAIISGFILRGSAESSSPAASEIEDMAAPEGWYPDPDGSGVWRYWAGDSWTDLTTNSPEKVDTDESSD